MRSGYHSMRSVLTWLPGVSAAVDSAGDPVDEHGGDEQWNVKQIKQVQYV